MPLISERSRKQVRLLLLLLVVLGAGALYTYVFVPQAERLDRAKADLQDAEMQLQMSLANLARANQAQIDLEDAVLRLDAAYARIPEDTRTSYVLRDLEELAEKTGAVVSNVSFADAKTVGRFLEIPFSVNLTGTFDGVTRFVDELARLTRIVTVRSYRLASGVSLPGASSDEDEAGDGSLRDDTNYINLVLDLSTYARPKGGDGR